MKTKIGINGFGRIGRQVLKAIKKYHEDKFDVVAVLLLLLLLFEDEKGNDDDDNPDGFCRKYQRNLFPLCVSNTAMFVTVMSLSSADGDGCDCDDDDNEAAAAAVSSLLGEKEII